MGALESQVVFVTGAADGLGLAISSRFSAEGATVVMVDRDRERLESVVGGIPAAVAAELDVTNHAAACDLVRGIADRFGRLDVAVNTVGRFQRQRTAEVAPVDWDAMLEINLKAPFFVCQAAGEVMRRQGRGCIVNVSSVAAYYPRSDQALYCTAKAGLEHLSRALALDLAADGVRVNVLRPGLVDTAMGREASESPGATGRAFGAGVPLGTAATAADLADGALFLAQATHMTGQVLCIDGGQTIKFAEP